MRRKMAILKAHVLANLYCLKWFLKDAAFGNPELIRHVPLVYTRWSVDTEKGKTVKRVRHISVGYWDPSMIRGQPDRWVCLRVYFLEEFDLRTQKWKRMK